MVLGRRHRARAAPRPGGSRPARPLASLGRAVPLLVCLVASSAWADREPEVEASEPRPRPTVQRRYAQKEADLYLHAGGTAHVRDDFYDVWGGTLHLGFYFMEPLAIELGVAWLASTLNEAAVQIRQESGRVPDARPQQWLLQAGVRFSLGYAKALLLSRFLSHFDPQVFLFVGIAQAQNRWVPTLNGGFGLLVHLPLGIQIQADLGLASQIEERTRGWVPGFGLMPRLSVGWAFDVRSLATLAEGES